MVRGQSLEHSGAIGDAITCYDRAIGLFSNEDASQRAQLGVAWMNRGSALQRLQDEGSLPAAVQAYEKAIALLEAPAEEDEGARNSLGAAWMNRGQLQLRLGQRMEALASLESATHLLVTLPAGQNPAVRHNLAGTHINRAQVLLDLKREIEARIEATAALALSRPHEISGFSDAQIALMARYTLCDALGKLIVKENAKRQELVFEANELVEEGLVLACDWENRGEPRLRPIAARLFRFGAGLYAHTQPHFLAEYISEILAGPLSAIPHLPAIAVKAIDMALNKPPAIYFTAGDPTSERWAHTCRELRATRLRLVQTLPIS